MVPLSFLSCLLIFLNSVAINAAAPERSWLEGYSGVASPGAIVTEGWARFTVLTASVIRMESSPDGSWDDVATVNIINRALPVPAYDVVRGEAGELRITTANVELVYKPSGAPAAAGFVEDNLRITLRVFPFTVWTPGSPRGRNLHGTIRTLDRVGEAVDLTCVLPRDAMTYYAHCEEGLISRDGWVVIDDSLRPRLDPNVSATPDEPAAHVDKEWPWVIGPPRVNIASLQMGGLLVYHDLYFFGHGLDFKQARTPMSGA